MVSNEEIKRMLEDRRRGVKPVTKKEAPAPVPSARQTEETQICESCGAENPEDAKFCIGCGNTLQKETPEEIADESLPQSGSEDYKICPNCQHHNKSHAKFCVVCGHKMDDVNAQTAAETEPVVEEVPPLEEVIAPEEEAVIEEPISAEAPATEEIVTEEIVTEEPVSPEEPVIEAEPVPEESESVPEEKAPPEVKTFKLGQRSLKKKEPDVIIPTPDDEEETLKTPASDSNTASEVDPVEKIKKAKELLDIGAITSEEFEEIKKKYLAMI